jgi:hypothetical protein
MSSGFWLTGCRTGRETKLSCKMSKRFLILGTKFMQPIFPCEALYALHSKLFNQHHVILLYVFLE